MDSMDIWVKKIHSIKKIVYLLILLITPFDIISADLQLNLNTFAGPPLSNQDHTGLYDLLITEGFRRIDIKVTISHLPAERSIRNANTGLDDGDFVRISGLNKIYTNLIQIPEKIADYKFTAFSKRADINYRSWSDLRPYQVGIVRGWKILEENLKDVEYLFKIKNQHLLFSMLNKDRLDLIIYSKFEGYWIKNKFGYSSNKALEPPLATREMFLYLNIKHSHLVPRIDRAFKGMKSDGTFNQIMSKALSPYNLEIDHE